MNAQADNSNQLAAVAAQMDLKVPAAVQVPASSIQIDPVEMAIKDAKPIQGTTEHHQQVLTGSEMTAITRESNILNDPVDTALKGAVIGTAASVNNAGAMVLELNKRAAPVEAFNESSKRPRRSFYTRELEGMMFYIGYNDFIPQPNSEYSLEGYLIRDILEKCRTTLPSRFQKVLRQLAQYTHVMPKKGTKEWGHLTRLLKNVSDDARSLITPPETDPLPHQQ